MARYGAGGGDGGRIVRTIPVRANRRRADRQFRLAAGIDGIRGADAAGDPAVAGAGDAGRGPKRRARRAATVVQSGAGGSLLPPFLWAIGPSLLHLRLSAAFILPAPSRLTG